MTVALVGPLLSIAPGIASVAIKIVKIQYDSPGTDDGSNATLNNEYVVIKNAGSGAVRLDDWVLKDKAGHKYTFGCTGTARRPRSGAGCWPQQMAPDSRESSAANPWGWASPPATWWAGRRPSPPERWT